MRDPFAINSKIRIISCSSIQYPMRLTRLGWRSWQSNSTSVPNSLEPRYDVELLRFIATFMLQSPINPLYILPKSLLPINKSLSKLLVAILISASENRRHNPSGRSKDCFALFPDVLNNFEIYCEIASIDASLTKRELSDSKMGVESDGLTRIEMIDQIQRSACKGPIF